MKGKVVLIQFPFDDLSSSKVRPAYCLTNKVGRYQHLIFALITSRTTEVFPNTELLLEPGTPDFVRSGLRKASIIRLDHLITLRHSMVRRILGELSIGTKAEITKTICNVLSL